MLQHDMTWPRVSKGGAVGVSGQTSLPCEQLPQALKDVEHVLSPESRLPAAPAVTVTTQTPPHVCG